MARLDAWTHGAGNEPLDWQVQVSTDNLNWTTVYSTTAPQCRIATQAQVVG